MQKNIILHPRYFVKKVAPQAIKNAIKDVCPDRTAHINVPKKVKTLLCVPNN